MKFINILLLLSVIIFTSCSSTKKTHQKKSDLEDTPAWVMQKPFVDGYYVGVGGVKKVGTANEYFAKAREKALADIAAGISSTISSSSVLHKIESQYGSTETFSQYIKVEATEYLEGFEPVHTWETKDMYWVCYQINKQTYLENKDKKKNEAIKAAILNRDVALKKEKAGDIIGALEYYIKAFEDLENYVMEPCFVEFNKTETDLGSFIVDKISHIISHIQIDPVEKKMDIKRHLILDKHFEFKVLYESIILGGIPVSFHYSGGYLKEHIVYTSKSGNVSCKLSTSSNKLDKAVITAQLAWEKFINHTTKNLIVRRLLKPIMSRKNEIDITLLPPTLKFIATAPELTDAQLQVLQNKLDIIAGKYRFQLVNDKQDSDFTFETTITLKEGEKAAGLISYYAHAELRLKNERGEIINSKKTTSFKGVDTKPIEAKNTAIEACIKSCSNHYIPSMLEDI